MVIGGGRGKEGEVEIKMIMKSNLKNKKLKNLKWLAESDLTKLILASVATAGFLSLAVAVPGILQIVGHYQKNRKRYQQAKYVNRRLEKLIKDGLIKVINDDGERKLSLTTKGERELEKGRLVVELEGKKWDGKWRIVIFDILEKRRRVRGQLRLELQELGFKKMQNSAWITPHDCGDYIYLVKTDLRLGQSIVFFEVSKIEDEKYWRQKFNLKL